MLSLRNISKIYHTGGETVNALRDVSLDFRTNEFVSILGPSGGGKTTLLNIIGGLDQYSDGDLIINGRSTKQFRDRDWDTYRNHSVGFVFQSYNLIPHQTVLQNVELALTLSGVPKSQRKEKAKKALEAVGLGNQINKKPNEMSGGQMQRVAIARAIVNDPDIILADEPTGALDTQTSIQVMEILKDIAKDRLVVMVTHNPELAEEYSTRIVRLRDGQIIDDSNPLTEEEIAQEKEAEEEKDRLGSGKKPSMSLFTSFGLSFKNLLSKKARTLLTSFAGSIGIIGIALIYAVSQGTTNYIDSIQQDTLSTYPLSISSESADMTSMLTAFGAMMKDEDIDKTGKLIEKQVMGQVFAQIGTNDLKSLKSYIDAHYSEIDDYVNEIRYSYGISPRIYTHDVNGDLLRVNPTEIFSGYYSGSSSICSEMITAKDLLDSQYQLLQGRWPEKWDEVIFVLTDENIMTDYMAYCLGLLDREEISDMMEKVNNSEEITLREEPNIWTYDDIMNLELRLVYSYQYYRYNEDFNVWENLSSDEDYINDLVENSEYLHITGIVTPREGVNVTALSMGINYTPELVKHIIANASGTDIVAAQLKDKNINVFSGKPFTEEEEEQSADLNNIISVDSNAIAQAFGFELKQDQLEALLGNFMKEVVESVSTNTQPAYDASVSTLEKLSEDMLLSYIEKNTADGMTTVSAADGTTYAASYLGSDRAKAITDELKDSFSGNDSQITQTMIPILRELMQGFTQSLTGTEASVILPEETLKAQIPAIVGAGMKAVDENAVSKGLLVSLSISLTESNMKGTIARVLNESVEKMTSSLSSVLGIKVDGAKIASAFTVNMTEEDLTRLMNTYSGNTSASTADGNLRRLGYSRLSEPNYISVYLKDFTAKEKFIDFLDDYNDKMEKAGKEECVVTYTDTTGILMSSVKTIVDSVSYVLIAFVSISLIVSSIMIGVITLISVQERTKEIGILRAIGASKMNVSSMFNAETVIIGFISGLVGIGITYLLCIPINIILYRLTKVAALQAHLPGGIAVILVLISVTMTLIAGIIPSRSAAKKDPVVALRTE